MSNMNRRTFWKLLSGGGLAALLVKSGIVSGNQTSSRFLRPPGALAEDSFLESCIRCGKCGESCPNDTIKFFGLENGWASLNTPFITPREKPCILCMKCGEVCPTGAIQRIKHEAEDILANVKMGTARINKDLCLSYQGKSCGVCYRACPLPDVSMTIGYMEQPTVEQSCVGCGICERACIQMPQAIRIKPNEQRAIG